MKKEKKAISIYSDVYEKFRTEKLVLQNEKNNPDLSANDALDLLIDSARKFRELKSKGLAKE